MLGPSFSSTLDWGSYIFSYAFKKMGALIHSRTFLSPEVALYHYKSTIQPSTKYYCHLLAGASSCYLDILDKAQKWVYRIIGPPLTTFLEPLANCWNIASLVLFYTHYFGICSLYVLLNWPNCFCFHIVVRGLFIIVIGSGVDTGCFQHQYTNFGHTILGMPKSNL